MNRRVFLKGGALSLLTLGLSPSFLRRTALAMDLPRAAKGKTLIVLFQRGAADAVGERLRIPDHQRRTVQRGRVAPVESA